MHVHCNRFDIINLVIVSAIYFVFISIKLHSDKYHIQVIDIRSYAKDSICLTLAKH